jgi:Flp pilus assembly protein TadB
MTGHRRHFDITDARRAQSERLRGRRRWYFALMGTCVALILLAWTLVRLWSTTAAVVMSIVAAVLAPVAVLIANWDEDH